MYGCDIVGSFPMTDLTAPTLMGQLASGSAARHRWPVPFSTWASALAPGGDGSQLGQRVRPVLGDHRLVGKSPEGSRQPGGATRTLIHLFLRRRSGRWRPLTCTPCSRQTTATGSWCSMATRAASPVAGGLRTYRGDRPRWCRLSAPSWKFLGERHAAWVSWCFSSSRRSRSSRSAL
jgi:hypothetical protein